MHNKSVNLRIELFYWLGAAIVGIIAVAFAEAADLATRFRIFVTHNHPWTMLFIAPAGITFSLWVTRTWFRGAQGSGIPQAIACLHLYDMETVDRILSLRISIAKICLTCFGLFVGASIGREGPTVQIGASIMHTVGRFAKITNVSYKHALIKAGAAAGVAAAFNTPLAGIVFGIEELSRSFKQYTSGVMLTCVIISGITAISLVGNYTYFGHVHSINLPTIGWIAVPVCGILGGLAGGTFSLLLIRISRGLPGKIGKFITHYPLYFSALCGLILSIIGLLSNGAVYGTGYSQARDIIMESSGYQSYFFILKLIATLVSYCSGIPGGLFSPSLSIGAGMGEWLKHLLPHTPPEAVVLLATVAYFSAVTQSPLTATIIVMEMCDNQEITLAIMASAFLAFGVSRLLCSHTLYSALALIFLRTVDIRKPLTPPSFPTTITHTTSPISFHH